MAFLPVLDLADAMFARKFDPAYDEGILDAVDRLRLDEHQAKHRPAGNGGGAKRGFRVGREII